jgi:hypothetical protein
MTSALLTRPDMARTWEGSTSFSSLVKHLLTGLDSAVAGERDNVRQERPDEESRAHLGSRFTLLESCVIIYLLPALPTFENFHSLTKPESRILRFFFMLSTPHEGNRIFAKLPLASYITCAVILVVPYPTMKRYLET